MSFTLSEDRRAGGGAAEWTSSTDFELRGDKWQLTEGSGC